MYTLVFWDSRVSGCSFCQAKLCKVVFNNDTSLAAVTLKLQCFLPSLPPTLGKLYRYTKVLDSVHLFVTKPLVHFNPIWHEAGHFYLPCNLGIGFCQLNLYQKFPNFFGDENWHQSGFDTPPSSLSLTKMLLDGAKDEHFSCFLSLCQLELTSVT